MVGQYTCSLEGDAMTPKATCLRSNGELQHIITLAYAFEVFRARDFTIHLLTAHKVTGSVNKWRFFSRCNDVHFQNRQHPLNHKGGLACSVMGGSDGYISTIVCLGHKRPYEGTYAACRTVMPQ